MNKLLYLTMLAGSLLSLSGLSQAASYPVNVDTSYRLVGMNLWNAGRFTNVFAPLPGISKAYGYHPTSGYTFATKKGAGAWSADLPLEVGGAVYIQGGAPTTVTISGNPMTQIINDPPWTTTTNLTLIGFDPVNNYYLRASQLFDQGNPTRQFKYQEIMGAEPVNGVAVYKPFPSGVPAPPSTPATTPGAWDVHVFNYGTWSGGEPTVVAGEGVWIGPAPSASALPIPWVFSTTPTRLNPTCGSSTITLHGAGFSASSTVELLPGSIPCTGPVVNADGTELTAAVPVSIAAGNYTIVVRNSATVASLPFGIVAGGPKINSNWPNNVGLCEPVNVFVCGGGFCPSATLVATPLAGGASVAATAVTVDPSGDRITGTFDFGTSTLGMYSLTVQNPGGALAIRASALMVGGLEAKLDPPSQMAGNCGPFTLTLNGSLCTGDEVRLVSNDGTTTIAGTVTALTGIWNGYKSMTASFDLNGKPALAYHAELRRGAGPWTTASGTLTVFDTSTCPIHLEFAGRTRVGYTRVNTYTITLRNLGCSPTLASSFTVSFPAGDNPAFGATTAGGVISPANVVTFSIPALAPGQAYPVGFDLLLPNANTTCTLTAVDSLSGCNAMIIPIDVVTSQDPNSKDGLPGHGPAHSIVGDEVLPYEIHFENKPSATAPAQDVFISDRLNPAQFDLSTFSLGEIKFGNRVITPPPGLTSYSEIVTHDGDGDPATTTDQMLLVVEGELVTDPSSADLGRLTWSYRTLDPLTLASPADIDLGFLPPNTLPPIGEGSVKYSVKLLPGMLGGVAMGSGAVIIFDANQPIATNPWYNQLATPVPLVIRQNADLVEIEWSGAPGTFTLEETTQLGDGANWTTVGTAPVSVAGGLQRVTLTPEGGEQKYFRLRL